MNLSGSGKSTKINVAIKVPFKEANPPIITIATIGIICKSVNEEGSINVI